MIPKMFSSIFIAWYIGIGFVATQSCIFVNVILAFSTIRNLTLSDDAIITWNAMPAENCIIDFYLVYTKSGIDQEQLYNTTETTMDVSFMNKCTIAQFQVIPVSPDGVEGSNFFLMTTMPLPPNVNLTLSDVRLSPKEGGVLLEWDIEEKWRSCVRVYRVVVHDKTADSSTDIYSSVPTVTVPYLVPCTTYDIGVRALNKTEVEGPISLVTYKTPAVRMSPPTLRNITVGTTSIDMTWNIEEYRRNRCAASYFTVDSSPFFSFTYPIVDQTNRPPVAVRVNNLQPDTIYLLNVTVYNIAGSSRPTLLAVQTLDND